MEEAIRCFTLCNASINNIRIIGDWAVNENNDIVNINHSCNRYFIASNNPALQTREQILEHLSNKTWFNEEQRCSLLEVLNFIGRV
ncbi:MAG: hypothetical protein J6J06_04065 [Bacteroidaceae bacterium]|nr:hypothetical protein [Bacteroidaceae bacterium]